MTDCRRGGRVMGQAKDTDLIQYATEIKVRAERRCGELLRDSERNKGATVKGGMAVERRDTRSVTLAEMGLTRDESSRYQQIASMSAATRRRPRRGSCSSAPLGVSFRGRPVD